MTPSKRARNPVFLTALAIAGTLSLATELTGCSGGGSTSSDTPAAASAGSGTGGNATTPDAASGSSSGNTSGIPASGAAPKATVLNDTLGRPWSLAFLPDGRMLVTLQNGRMVLLSADGRTVSAGLTGLPAVETTEEQGGLLDVALDPDFDLSSNPMVYWAYSEPSANGTSTVAVARGKLVLNGNGVVANSSPGSLQSVTVIYRQQPAATYDRLAGQHGARLVFRADKTLFITLGDRQRDQPENPTSEYSQNLTTTLGKVVRIRADGTVPSDNPFASNTSARSEIWSYGHRNPQGAAINPATGDLWLTEHGPQGGDELNRSVAGGNYGWPLRSYGCPYSVDYTKVAADSCRVGGGTHAPTFIEPVTWWAPKSIAPSGLTFYTGGKFPEWKGSILMGAMRTYTSYPGIQQGLWRVILNGNALAAREHLDVLDEDVRDVRQGPDGWIYVLTKSSGKLIRIER